MRSTLVLSVLVLTACSSSEPGDAVQACIDDHPVGADFDVGDVGPSLPPPGSLAPEAPPTTVESIAEACRIDQGNGCNPSLFFSREAAECIARSEGLAAGMSDWLIRLEYDYDIGRVVWNVDNQLDAAEVGNVSGVRLTLDATQGVVIRQRERLLRP